MGTFKTEEKKELLDFARKAIKNYLKNKKTLYPDTNNQKYLEERGAFVTLHIKGKLRGCIGHPIPVDKLINSIVDNAIASAFKDPRFSNLSEDEFSKIDIEISVLTHPQVVKSPMDVQVGRDGIIITKGMNRGLLLPQVPVEQGWDLNEYLSYGCLKAGLPMNEWEEGIKIETFQAEIFGELELLQE